MDAGGRSVGQAWRFDELARSIDGELLVDPAARDRPKPFNARFDRVTPRAVVRCTSDGDVSETVSFIRRHDLACATRSGGHCFAGRSTTSGVLIDISPMRSVSVADGTARVGAGARLGEVYLDVIPAGITIPGGTCPSVGIAGLTLGGGLGFLGRRHGLTSDRLVGARIVRADGRTIECDEDHDGDLFWALRGGGAGQFGVVTELRFQPVPVPAVVTSFRLTWAFDQAADVARAWMAWSPLAGDELSASLVIATGADPEQAPTVEVFGTMLGGTSDARAQLEDLTARISDPASDSVEEASYAGTLRTWAARAGERMEDPRAEPTSRATHFVKSEFFARSLPADAVSGLLQRLAEGRVTGQSQELDFSPWGGAYTRVPAEATAFVHRDAMFCLKQAVVVDADASAAEQAAAQAWLTDSWNTVHPWGTGGVFPNFPDPDLPDSGHAYYGANLERLVETKARYDPGNVFRSTQSLPVP